MTLRILIQLILVVYVGSTPYNETKIEQATQNQRIFSQIGRFLLNIDRTTEIIEQNINSFRAKLADKISNIDLLNRLILGQNEVHFELLSKEMKEIKNEIASLKESMILKNLLNYSKTILQNEHFFHPQTPIIKSLSCKLDGKEKILDDVCLSWHNESKSWEEAYQFCESKEGHLYFPKLNDQQLDKKLYRLFPGRDTDFVWIGGKYHDGKFIVIEDGSEIPVSHSRWIAGHPFTKLGERSYDKQNHCLLMHFHEAPRNPNKLWIAQKYNGCQTKYKFFCAYN